MRMIINKLLLVDSAIGNLANAPYRSSPGTLSSIAAMPYNIAAMAVEVEAKATDRVHCHVGDGGNIYMYLVGVPFHGGADDHGAHPGEMLQVPAAADAGCQHEDGRIGTWKTVTSQWPPTNDSFQPSRPQGNKPRLGRVGSLKPNGI